ncbi:MAG: DUF6502 family protein [Candidatus Binatales bacterium]
MKTSGAGDRSSVKSRNQAVQRLLRDVAALCALGQVTEESAVAILRDGYRCARVASPGNSSANGDPFIAGDVLSEWHEDPQFLSPEGRPAPLSLATGAFARLCRKAAADADESGLLELLTQAGAIHRDGDTVTATRRELIVNESHPAGVARAIRMSSEFASTLSHNLSANVREPGWFERSVASSKLSTDHLPALRAYLSVHGQSFLEDLDSWIAARESAATGCTIGVGVYLFVDSENS